MSVSINAKSDKFLYRNGDVIKGMEITNKSLAVLLIAAMFVSVGGAMLTLAMLGSLADVLKLPGITGFGVVGAVNVSLQETINLNVSQSFADFGVGYVETGQPGAEIVAGYIDYNWTVVGSPATQLPFRIQNIGNVNLSVSVVSDKNALHFVGGGTAPSFMYLPVSITNACTGLMATTTEIAEDGGLQNNTKNVCSQLQFLSGQNEINISAKVYIPYDAPFGNKTAIWTFNASAA